MRDYLLMSEMGAIKKNTQKQCAAQSCRYKKQLNNNFNQIKNPDKNVNKQMLKPATVINNRNYINGDRQNKIDNFIMYYAYRRQDNDINTRFVG